jgi:hypothetical protein
VGSVDANGNIIRHAGIAAVKELSFCDCMLKILEKCNQAHSVICAGIHTMGAPSCSCACHCVLRSYFNVYVIVDIPSSKCELVTIVMETFPFIYVRSIRRSTSTHLLVIQTKQSSRLHVNVISLHASPPELNAKKVSSIPVNFPFYSAGHYNMDRSLSPKYLS